MGSMGGIGGLALWLPNIWVNLKYPVSGNFVSGLKTGQGMVKNPHIYFKTRFGALRIFNTRFFSGLTKKEMEVLTETLAEKNIIFDGVFNKKTTWQYFDPLLF